MKSGIYCITSEQLPQLKKQIISNTWIAEIDGKKALTWVNYAHQIEKAMRFPTPCDKGMDGYLDWICDLDWLEADAYVIIINNFNEFMLHDLERKKKVISYFDKHIIPWWDGEVEKFVVEGKKKPFQVYLVN